MSYILGLDLGTNSIGWTCINEKDEKILDFGVRIFQKGVDRDTKGKEVSKNATRRKARQTRRQLWRRRLRKDLLIEVLREHKMFPESEKEIESFFKPDSYELRARGLDEKLTQWEFGRVLYHLSQRRGFKSSRSQRRGFKSSRKGGEAKEDGTVVPAINELQNKIDENDCRTLGEYLFRVKQGGGRIRAQYTSRKMYAHEFELLWNSQRRFYPEFDDDLKTKIRNIVFFQRPLQSVAHLIGNCSLEPDKKRCPKSHFDYQVFRILEQVNRLSYFDADGVEQRFCRDLEEDFAEDTAQKRDLLIAELRKNAELKFDKIKKLLGLPPDTVFNLEKGGEKKLLGNRTAGKLAKIFDKKWNDFSDLEKEKIYQTICLADHRDDPEWLEQYAATKWELKPDKAEKLAKKTHFEPGYSHLSLKAIRKLIPFLEDGFSLSSAREKAGYKHGAREMDVEERLKNLRNPIVLQTLYELLRLLKIIEKVHGRPDKIRVELVRDLKNSAKKRQDIHFENLDRKEENRKIRERLEEMNVRPNHDAVLKYKLWQECKKICPYTGKTISQDDLFSASPQFQIEHIFPKPRSGDDSFMNKTLCYVDENIKKGNQTPYEAYHGKPQYDEILQRVKVLPYSKRKRFTQKEIPGDFIARQLNDTAYISREAKSLLESLGHKVTVCKGQATADLRYLWGLNSLLRNGDSTQNLKNRDDHRHHAIDAAVVAMTDERALHKLSAYNKYDREATREAFPPPWPSFREDLKPFVDKLLVSHRVNKRARGALHKKHYYGDTGTRDEKGVPFYAIRKPLKKLEPAMVNKIIDPAVKEIVKTRLNELGIDAGAKKIKIPKGAFKDLFMKTYGNKKIPIKKVRIRQASNNMVLFPKLNKTGVEPGNNHHVVLYRYKDPKGKTKHDGGICTLLEAVRRVKNNEPIIRRELGEGREFLFSLSINEMILINMDESQIDWENPDYKELSKNLYRVQKMTAGKITLRNHLVAILEDEEGNEPGRLRSAPSSLIEKLKAIKVRTDRIGRIYKAHD